MKKVIFTAIAMIAFSGVSMANNIALKEIGNEDATAVSSNEKAEKTLFGADCNLVKFQMYNIAIDHGYTRDQASSYSYVAYFRCMSDNSKELQLQP